MTMSCLVSLVWAKCVIRVPDHNDKYRSSLTTGSDGLRIHPGGQDMSLILKLSQCKISRSGSLQQLAPESGAIVSCRRSCPGHAADEDEEEEVDEEEEEDEEEEKEAMEKEPHLTQMRLALADISSDPAELCALPRMISLTAQGIAEAVKGRQNQRTEELQRKMRSLAFKKMRWKLDKGSNQNSQHQHQTGSCGQRFIS